MSGPNDLYALEVELLTAVQAALASTIAGVPGRVVVSPGQPALDCDLATVWWTPITRSDSVGGQPYHQNVWINLVQLNVLVARCIPTGQDGRPPTVVQQNSAAQAIAQDAWAMNEYVAKRFVQGTLFAGFPCREESMSAIEQLAPSGGVGGSTMALIVELQGYDA